MISHKKKPNQLKECKLYHNSGVLTTKNNTFSKEHGLLRTSSTYLFLIKVRNSYPNNTITGHLNINTLQNKIISLREIVAKAPLDVLCVDETKLENNFPNSQLILENFQFLPFRRDRNSKWGGKLVYVKQGIITKTLENLETRFSETICIELTISKKKWYAIFGYRPPKQNQRY